MIGFKSNVSPSSCSAPCFPVSIQAVVQTELPGQCSDTRTGDSHFADDADVCQAPRTLVVHSLYFMAQTHPTVSNNLMHVTCAAQREVDALISKMSYVLFDEESEREVHDSALNLEELLELRFAAANNVAIARHTATSPPSWFDQVHSYVRTVCTDFADSLQGSMVQEECVSYDARLSQVAQVEENVAHELFLKRLIEQPAPVSSASPVAVLSPKETEAENASRLTFLLFVCAEVFRKMTGRTSLT